ncbi:MAG TPA: hypothetical protein VHJ20_06640 [Polyangia bacterium]|nr:hypothetical protein [Polyangia bacterium]
MPTSDEWDRCYEAASARRRARGRDPFERELKRQSGRRTIFLIGSSAFLAALIVTRYEVLIRVG